MSKGSSGTNNTTTTGPACGTTTRIVKNSIALYVRMGLSMGVSLYTSRVVLNVLGADDYGIYNVVGGIVVMFYFLNGAMAGGTQRFLNYEMGCGTPETLKKTFNVSLAIHIAIAVAVLLLAETIGLWFLNARLVIPPERLAAANWIYQFSILSAMITLTQVPYTATIIAHEKMGVYGYVGILEALLKLGVVLLLTQIAFDKLILYGLLSLGATLTIALIYRFYCVGHYPECRFVVVRDRPLYKKILGFSGWNLWGCLASIMTIQGLNIVLNLFFGPAVNASRAIASTVNGGAQLLLNGFTTAVNPQITQSYAVNDRHYFMSLVFRGAKFSFFLFFIVAAPILLQTDYIMLLWLKNPPEYIGIFCRLSIIDSLIYSLSLPLLTATQATGRNKVYEITIGIILLLNLPVSYLLLSRGLPPVTVYYVTIALSLCATIARLVILKRLVALPVGQFCRQVLLPCWAIFAAILLPLGYVARSLPDSWGNLIALTAVCMSLTVAAIWTLGLSRNERAFATDLLKRKFKK